LRAQHPSSGHASVFKAFCQHRADSRQKPESFALQALQTHLQGLSRQGCRNHEVCRTAIEPQAEEPQEQNASPGTAGGPGQARPLGVSSHQKRSDGLGGPS